MAGLGMCTATLLADPMAAGEAEVRAAGEACVAVGTTDVSVWAHHLPALTGLGLQAVAVEGVMGWANGEPGAAVAEAEHLLSLAAEHGATKLLAGCLDPEVADLEHARRNLALVVDAAEQVGVQVCVEFLPFGGIPDLATAWALVEPLGPSAVILLDTWHWQRQPGGPCPDVLATIPAERIGYLQVCDAGAEPDGDPMTDALTNRLLPGDGVVDITGVLAQLWAMGADPFVATEIFNPALVAERGAEGAARAMIDATLLRMR